MITVKRIEVVCRRGYKWTSRKFFLVGTEKKAESKVGLKL